jgi:hypothetical protein
LRPLGVGELLDGAFTVIRRYPAATLGFAALIMFAVEIVQVISNYYVLNNTTAPSTNGRLTSSDAADLLARVGTTSFVTLFVTGLAVLILTGVVTTVVGEGVLGRPINAAQAWARLRPVLGRLLGVSMMTFLIVAGALIAGVVPGIVVIAAGSGAGGAALLFIG